MTKNQKIVVIICAVVLVLLWAGLILRTADEKGCIGGNDPYVPEIEYDPINDILQGDAVTPTDAPSQTDAAPVVTPTDAVPVVSSTDAEPTAPPPAETIPDVRLVRIKDYIPNAVIELRYSTPENFTGAKQYNFSEAYLRYGAVKKLAAAAEQLAAQNYKIKIWDAYRPYETQCKLWESFPDPNYVSNPETGYLGHCRGGAVDVTIVNADGSEVKMPSGFDEFSAAADRDYSDVDAERAANAELLQQIMEGCGFVGEQTEWWHFTDSFEYEVEKRFVPAQ